MSPLIRANKRLGMFFSLLFVLAGWQLLVLLAPEHAPLTRLLPEEINQVSLERDGQPVWRLERQAGGWRMLEPVAAEADRARVNQLLRLYLTPSLRSWPLDETRLAEFGLAPPAYRLTNEHLVLEFGGTDPASGRRYVRIGQTLHLIGDGFLHHLSAPAEAFRRP